MGSMGRPAQRLLVRLLVLPPLCHRCHFLVINLVRAWVQVQVWI